MKCPVLVRIKEPDYSHRVVYPANCIKAKCAWWSEEMEQCDPTGLLPWLKHIEGHLGRMIDRMAVARE